MTVRHEAAAKVGKFQTCVRCGAALPSAAPGVSIHAPDWEPGQYVYITKASVDSVLRQKPQYVECQPYG